MKAQISRFSHDPTKRYSGVYPVQGGMLVDANISEQTELSRLRTDLLGNDTVDCGTPIDGGAVGISNDGIPYLKEGTIYADGVRGELTFLEGKIFDESSLNFLETYSLQNDYPNPPTPEHGRLLVFADIWERPVFDTEDGRLGDAGLSDVETSFRTRTMVQIKTISTDKFSADRLGTEDFPKIGNATLTADFTPLDSIINDCDPCANEVSVTARMHNHLVRLEVVHVSGTAKEPKEIELAWSISNAADREGPGDKLLTSGAAPLFEYYSAETECHRGVVSDPSERSRSAFSQSYPRPAGLSSGKDLPFVRAWTGWARIDLSRRGSITAANRMGSGNVVVSSSKSVTIALGDPNVTMKLDTADKLLVAGDYWLVELRSVDDPARQIHVPRSTPIGIEHHYCPLFLVDRYRRETKPVMLDDAQRRLLTFPSLSDIPADHISFVDECSTSVFKDSAGNSAQNVQQALSRLCDLDASSIAFDNECPHLFDGAKTVQDALSNLCRVNFSVERTHRYLFDWGVVCGLRVKTHKEGTELSISKGVFLDHGGTLVDSNIHNGSPFDVNKIKVIDDPKEFKTDMCLAVSGAPDGEVTVYLISQTRARKFWQPTMSDLMEEYEVFDAVLETKCIAVEPDLRAKVKLVLQYAARDNAGGDSIPLAADEANAVNSHLDRMLDSLINAVSPSQQGEVKEEILGRIRLAKNAYSLDGMDEPALKIQRGRRSIAMNGEFVKYVKQEFIEPRLCNHIHVPCPPHTGTRPFFVPIGLAECYFEDDLKTLKLVNFVCDVNCRKFAVTPRTRMYWEGDSFNDRINELIQSCCYKVDSEHGDKPDRKPTRTGKYGSSSPLDRNERHWGKLVDSRLPPEKKPGHFGMNLDGLDEAQARKIAKTKGADISNVIDVDSAEDLKKLATLVVDKSVLETAILGDKVRPGDKVSVLVKNGIVQSYLVTERSWGGGAGQLNTYDPGDNMDTGKLPDIDFSQLEGKRDSLRESILSLETKTNEIDKTRAAIADAVTSLRSTSDEELGSLKELRNWLEPKLGEYDKVASDLRKTHEELISAAGKFQEEAKYNLEQLQGQRSDFDTTMEGYQAQLKTLDEKHKQLLESVKELSDGVGGDLAGFEERYSGLNERSKIIETKYRSDLANLTETEKSQSDLGELLSGLKLRSEELEDRVKIIGSELESHDGQSAQLDMLLAKGKEAIDNFKSVRAEHVEIEKLRKDLSSKFGLLKEQVLNEFSVLRSSRTELETDLSAFKKVSDDLHLSRDVLKPDFDALQAQYDKLHGLDNDHDELIKSLDGIQAQQSSAENENTRLQITMNNLTDQADNLFKTTDTKMNEVSEKVIGFNETLRDDEKTLGQVQTRSSNLGSEIENHRKTIKSLKSGNTIIDRDLSKSIDKKEDLLKSIDLIENDRKQLGNEIKALEMSKSSLSEDLLGLQNKYRRIQSDVNKSNQKFVDQMPILVVPGVTNEIAQKLHEIKVTNLGFLRQTKPDELFKIGIKRRQALQLINAAGKI